MESEEERLQDLLFPDGYPSEWIDSSPLKDYISRVGSLTAEELQKEPIKLNDEKHLLEDQIQELAVSNYKVFLETAQCSQSLFGQFTLIENKLGTLLLDIPQFEKQFENFLNKTKDINSIRKLNSLTLTRNAQLLEILELPQLMESFINGGFYEDALELASYVRRLCFKRSDIQILKAIKDDVEKLWLVMLNKLLEQLRLGIQLPKCLQLVAYLRRMEIFSESELRMKFLQTRNTWLNNCLNSIPNDDPYHHLTKTIEVTRVNLFSIVTQYKAIFNDDEHGPLASPRNQLTNCNIIFFSWISDRVSIFLKTLEEDLDRGVSPLDTVLGQSMYFGLSFSRVGCDFRSLMVPIFVKTIKSAFKESVLKATTNFEKNIERFTFINKVHSNITWKGKDVDPARPPETLLEFYPLAEYLNQILIVFNELRSCLPFAIIEEIMSCLEESLLVISNLILILYNAEHQAFSANSKESFSRFCMCFADDLISYLQKCLHTIFPPNSVATYLGVSVQTLQKDGLLTINKSKVIDPIKLLLPPKIDPILDKIQNEDVKPKINNEKEEDTN
ncbi:conserved oligomeric Golgi complex subunit 8 [Agrilus planipennis]|uniref:Conserved oligomeric Golgi complex subunit 8 n=1 Tax=Agrilus planipennis TaxID=224129 RepID=A0A1W4WU60_AGRPL|nr:conserved oligomeric Golgi complex subunit 8 [Agrilus planipennis]